MLGCFGSAYAVYCMRFDKDIDKNIESLGGKIESILVHVPPNLV